MKKSLPSLAFALTLASTAMAAAPAALPPLLTEPEEIQAALEAAPAHLRADAGVYVLERNGYRQARQSRNGFNCLVDRELLDDFAPMCFDAEGSATLIPAILFRATERARGASHADVERELAKRYAEGKFVAPRRVGICYMLSERNVVITDRKAEKVGHVGPHLMFYAPNLRNGDLGASDDFASHFIVADEGTPGAMIIVPVATAGDGHEHH